MAGAARIGALHVMLGLDSAQFTAGLAKANSGLSKFASGAKIGLAAVAVAAAAAGTALGIAVKGAIDNADSMGEMAQKVGVSVEALTSLGYAAKLSGTDTDTLATGLRKLSQNMLAIAQGSTGPVAAAFAALGVSAQNANGSLRASDEVLIDVADKFARMEDGATKTALAVQLFGKSGAELIPFLNQGREGIGALTDEADRLGITVSGSTANAAGAFNDTLDRLNATFGGIINQIAGGVLPSLNEFSAKLSDPQFAASAQAIGVAVVEGMKLAIDAINTVVGALSVLKQGMDALGIQNKGAGFQKFNTEDEAKAIITEKLQSGQTSTPTDIYQGIFGATAAEVETSASAVAEAFVPVIQNTQAASAAASALNSAMSAGKAVFEATRTPAEAYGLEVERLNGLLAKGAIDQDTYNRAVIAAQDAFDKADTAGSHLASSLSSGLANVFSSIVDGSKSAIEAIGDLIASLGQLLINKAFEGLIGGIFGGGGGFRIPGFANGTNFAPGGLAMVGERGPELVNLPRGAQVIPNNELGGGASIQINISGSQQDAAAIAREVRRVLPDAITQFNQNPYRRS